MCAGVSSAFSRRSARYRGLGLQSLYNSRTWSGISIQGSADTSWAMMACGKIGARSAGPIGCKVCGFRYGAGGAGMSGRMLYQRSGMSFSSRRIFLVIAPASRSVSAEDASSARVALRGRARTPAPVPLASPFADQVQAWPGSVGAARRRFAASALELDRPRDCDVLLGGGVKRPGGVVEVRPAQRAEVSPSGQDDRVHVVVGSDC